MHKDKDGKVVASLTEVKNKTGDIFNLVDEFGEVVLTSYNKPRYKISKINISDTLTLKQNSKKEAPTPKKQEKTAEATPVQTKESASVKSEKESEMSEKFVRIVSESDFWDRDNKLERSFLKKALKPLQ